MPALTANPRFLFVHKKRKRFVWLEVDGPKLLRAEGALGEEASATPAVEVLASPSAAARQRDLATAKLLESGFALADFGASAPKKKKGAKRALGANPELEATVRERDDDVSWQVFEDWLLAEEDPRAEII